MKFDIIIAGVGGQGVLSLASILSTCAMRAGLYATQSEVHGMAQRGGAVEAHLRLADHAIYSPTITGRQADLILALEPLEALRHFNLLSPAGSVIAASEPVKNIDNYPELTDVHSKILAFPRGYLLDATKIARLAGAMQAVNVVMIGAATDFLPLEPAQIRDTIGEVFRSKGDAVVATNLKAYDEGHKALRHREIVSEFETLVPAFD